MKKFIILSAVCAAMLTVSAGQVPVKPAIQASEAFTESIKVSADKIEAACGDKINFTIKVSGKNIAKRAVIVEVDGNAKIRKKKIYTTDDAGMIKIETTSDRPGMVYCRAVIKGQPNKRRSNVGVAVDKFKVTSSRPCPADFNAYWNNIKAALDARPMDAVLTPEPVKNKALKAFKVIFPMGGDGKDGYGKLSYPANAKAKSLPAFLLVHGAGTGVHEARGERRRGRRRRALGDEVDDRRDRGLDLDVGQVDRFGPAHAAVAVVGAEAQVVHAREVRRADREVLRERAGFG